MDTWESRAAYEEFRKKYAEECGSLDLECGGLTVSETHLPEWASLNLRPETGRSFADSDTLLTTGGGGIAEH